MAVVGRPLFRLGMILAAATVALDQASKLWILHGLRLPERFSRHLELGPVFDLTYTENTGISFGLFAGGMTSRVILSVLSLVISAFIVRWLTTIERPVTALGAGMILGGAIGNLIDRVLYGFVVDFINFGDIGFAYIFNIADAGINVGVALLLLDTLVLERREKKMTE
ncbi:MAG: signal peptidase II [Parvularculaceae bacterium]|nr:signal peptidase II [Parvularculaceae bacterium]